MLFFYSTVLAIGFVLMLPLFFLRREKYAAGFSERLGNYPRFEHDGRPVIWLHCVSVGETNAARPLVDQLAGRFPDHRIVISTTTRTGQELARKIFADKADAVIYFPFDFKFSVRRALQNFKPSVILLMETEIWPRFIREAGLRGARVAIVNGRLSERSFRRYSKLRPLVSQVLSDVDLALMQGEADAEKIRGLGVPAERIAVTGNLKYDLALDSDESELTAELAKTFGLDQARPLIIAASTHEPEERWVIEAYCSLASDPRSNRPRLLIAPRHPERFDKVAKMFESFRGDPSCEWTRYTVARRSLPDEHDANADIIILDTIGELRAAYPLAAIVFVGGSMIPHGGQSFLEPASAGVATITGSHTANFADAVSLFLEHQAIVQLDEVADPNAADELFLALSDLLEDEGSRQQLGANASAVMNSNRGATAKTIAQLVKLISPSEKDA